LAEVIGTTVKYGVATRKGSPTEDQDFGMEAGIAMKSGNADGAKVSTVIGPRK
jgi:hypothetical protein